MKLITVSPESLSLETQKMIDDYRKSPQGQYEQTIEDAYGAVSEVLCHPMTPAYLKPFIEDFLDKLRKENV